MRNKNGQVLVWILVVALIIGLVILGWFLMNNSVSQETSIGDVEEASNAEESEIVNIEESPRYGGYLQQAPADSQDVGSKPPSPPGS